MTSRNDQSRHDTERLAREQVQLEGRWLAVGIGAFLAVDIAIVVMIALAAGLSAARAAVIVLLMIGAAALAFAAATWVLWMPMQRRFPEQPIEVGAVSRTWQSVSFGRLGRFNHCLRLTADAHHLHIHPFQLIQWCGAKRISLPWNRMTDVRLSRAPMSLSWAKVDGRRFAGPAWCLELAAISDEAENSSRDNPAASD